MTPDSSVPDPVALSVNQKNRPHGTCFYGMLCGELPGWHRGRCLQL